MPTTLGSHCKVDGCEHELWRARYCACHIPTFMIPESDMEDAVRIAALENDDFELDAEGKIRLKEEE